MGHTLLPPSSLMPGLPGCQENEAKATDATAGIARTAEAPPHHTKAPQTASHAAPSATMPATEESEKPADKHEIDESVFARLPFKWE